MKVTARQADNLKSVAIATLFATGTAAGLFFVGRHFYRQIVSTASQKDSLTEGDPATFAKQLKMAFENDLWAGMGTDEETVFRVFNELPSKAMYAKVQREYSRLYNNRSLNADLEDELSSDEYNELIRILSNKK